MSNQSTNVPPVDLVIVIDTSPSMKDEAQALSLAAESAIKAAKSSCPSDLRVAWFGIEGVWKGTKFNQTIRDYLTTKLKISESQLRGRKRGELKSAGAQEDAARAVEDISNFFDWRKNAKRAIFYLGDEALEGGGSKTEKADIAAANQAIEKAIAAKVAVNTYFGTSKSKHQEGVKKEYARVAGETGGRYFTDKDAIDGFSAVLEKVICGSRNSTIKLKPGTVYVQDSVKNELSKLYTLDLSTGKTNLIGEIATEISDIAFVDAELYGLDLEQDKSKLVKIDLNTGNAEAVGNLGFAASGLAYSSKFKTLYASTAKEIVSIDINTGKAKPVLKVADKDYNCGEIAFDSDAKAYVTLIGYAKKKLLAICDLTAGTVKNIGDTGFADIASLEFVGDTLYGVTGNFHNLGKDGQLICIDTKTGKGTLVTTTEPKGRWAGISIYQPVDEVNTVSESTSINDSKKQEKVSQVIGNQEKAMSLLTIDTKDNCYVIDPGQMNHLQQNVANSFTLDKGIYNISINSGSYKYAKSKAEGEPFVLLWIYGEGGATFVNQNTGFETGATWTTLNGYNNHLKIDVKQKAVICGLFFDVNNNENSGSIKLLITSNKAYFNPQELTIDSKNNCYVLDEKYLSSLKQSGKNLVEINPGNYTIKIREGNASYWSDNKKFKLEPWALLWVKGGKFVTKLAGVDSEESWISLNGFNDEIVLEVQEKTTLSGFFFDTYKEDNEGQIVLAIETINATELNNKKQQNKQEQQELVASAGSSSSTSKSSNSGSSKSTTTITSGGGSTSTTTVTTGVNSGKANFSFSFDEAQMEKMWQQMAAKINTSVTLNNDEDGKKEVYWDQLENWILKGYQNQAKGLAMQVARLEFMMKALTQQMEVNFNQNYQAWTGHFDSRIHDLMTTRINSLISEKVGIQINDQSQNIKNLVVHQMQDDLEQRVDSALNLKISQKQQEIKNQVVQQMQQELEQRIDSVVNLKISNQAPEINNLVVQQIEGDIDKRIDNVVNLKMTNQSQDINNQVLGQIRNDMDGRIDSVVNLKIADQSQNIKNLVVQQMQSDMEKRIDAIVNLKVADLGQDINNQVTQQIKKDVEERIDSVVNLKISDQSQNIKNQVVHQIQSDIDNRINSVVDSKTDNNVNVVVNNVIGDIDNRINANFENKIINFRDDVSSIVKNEVSNNMDSIKTNVLSDIRNQQFFTDMQSIKAEVENFYSRLGQFETQLNLRISQGDTQLYNWTLEQLTALQGCLTDREALVEMFETFSAQLKNKLDGADCVNPTRFTQLNATISTQQLSPSPQTPQLPGNS
ncbi:hypothetical protein Riv7116_6328 [Rivularia sp. PCC 7116]|uniref:hypothetical protein n=1 Tax=Rivularia sp. PCC 7116 TaxID=373994 RepID=UPI00029F194E|nr:hypothetical protein [Rivularia sp. PCC 7116]AFY58670.1 hypothetical protein Riv7116_6328 [Rivularia sp. PCC 7116]